MDCKMGNKIIDKNIAIIILKVDFKNIIIMLKHVENLFVWTMYNNKNNCNKNI